jgi:hypothetical protein
MATITLPSETRILPVDTGSVDATKLPAGTLVVHNDGVNPVELRTTDGTAFSAIGGGDLTDAAAEAKYLQITDASSTYATSASLSSYVSFQSVATNVGRELVLVKTAAGVDLGQTLMRDGTKRNKELYIQCHATSEFRNTFDNASVMRDWGTGDIIDARIKFMNLGTVDQTLEVSDNTQAPILLLSDVSGTPVTDVTIRPGNQLELFPGTYQETDMWFGVVSAIG